MKTIEEHKADVEAHQKRVDEYAAALPARPLGSGVLCHVPVELMPNTALLRARIQAAEMRLRLDLRVELLAIGSSPSEEELDHMIQGIPRDTYYQLVAKRT